MKPNLTLNVESSTSYKSFVASWKSSYKDLGEAIRKLKTPKSLVSKRYVETGDPEKDAAAIRRVKNDLCVESFAVVKLIWEALPELGPLPDHCRADMLAYRPDYSYSDTRMLANYMLAIRKHGKVLAQAAYEKATRDQSVAA